ncbi:MAG: type II toxin-antitoxin system Phd/YefM family antitoxin [Thermoanaerobaculia bacterium]
MTRVTRKGAEEARNQMPSLLEAAERGDSTIITRHGRPVAALVPVAHFSAQRPQQALSRLKGTGRGLWGRSSAQTIRSLRDEWSR